jgi:hypothetical protein
MYRYDEMVHRVDIDVAPSIQLHLYKYYVFDGAYNPTRTPLIHLFLHHQLEVGSHHMKYYPKTIIIHHH